MDFVTLIGYLAAICTTIAFIPQVVRIVKTKDTKGISLIMYITFTIGVLSWLIYGICLNELPIVLCNAVTLVLSVTIVGFKIKYG